MRFGIIAIKSIKFVLIFIFFFIVLLGLAVSGLYFLTPKLSSPISLLILGKGGDGHTAPNLTDTIMVSYLNTNQNNIKFLSLPRDIWIPEIRAKLNTAYHYGGFKMAGESVTSVTGLPTNYTVVIDFSLFKDLIDAIGGITVDVENAFIDEKYPIAGLENDLCGEDKQSLSSTRTYNCRYEVLNILDGRQNMNGELALKFVRSRNAKGDEGTDIAREKRQQKVILAIKEKILSRGVILSPGKIKSLYDVIVSHTETDIDKNTMMVIAKFVVGSKFNINFLSIPEDKIIVSQGEVKYDKQYVFIPKNGSWKELQSWVSESL